ncbi:MAG: sulfate reduction electron transfer complex DsrMKJOP subunit DsrM [Spirochaetia bacterium]|nr:sulfate reduction electron transfer complex DsrMKJOP subunit DsrM [Spirochaetia bacterium]
MKILFALITVLILSLAAFTGVEYLHMEYVFGIVIPYAAFIIFIAGFTAKIFYWAKSPVPFNITTTAGQQKSLKWIKSDHFENPSGSFGVIGRMFMEIFFFRSLFRNTKAGLVKSSKSESFKPGYASDKSLWLGGLMFHWSFLYILIRHLRFFLYPIPSAIVTLEKFDSMFQIGLPIFYLTDAILLLSVTFLFLRRVFIPQVKYISLIADFIPLFLILAIAFSGIMMRYVSRVDVIGVKELVMSLTSFSPALPEKVSSVFYVHFFLVSSLFMYFPFSKLMHMGGVFFSPTRNMTGDSRRIRHVNPWNYSVKVHSYEEYEDEFREAMKGAGLPLDKE